MSKQKIEEKIYKDREAKNKKAKKLKSNSFYIEAKIESCMV